MNPCIAQGRRWYLVRSLLVASFFCSCPQSVSAQHPPVELNPDNYQPSCGIEMLSTIR